MEEVKMENEDMAEGGGHHMMVHLLCLVTLDSTSSSSSFTKNGGGGTKVDMLFVGLGYGTLISFVVVYTSGMWMVYSQKEVSLESFSKDASSSSSDGDKKQ
eukprot:7899591-Ditylum_brightwellii.AAC.1